MDSESLGTFARQVAAQYESRLALLPFQSAIRHLSQELEPRNADRQARREAIDAIQKVVDLCYPAPSSLEVRAFGSFQAGLDSRGSDLDLALCGVIFQPNRWNIGALRPVETLDLPARKVILTCLANQLETSACANADGVQRCVGARIPVIKFVHEGTGVEVDVSCACRGRDLKNGCLDHIRGLSPVLAPLFRLVKKFAQVHGINSALEGTFNSWSILMMVVFSLQQGKHAPLPPLENALSTTPSEPRLLGTVSRLSEDDLQTRMEQCGQWCESVRGAGGWCVMRGVSPPAHPGGLLEHLHLFMKIFSTVFTAWHSGENRATRISPWSGTTVELSFSHAYLALIEDPFDKFDNCARSCGTQVYNRGCVEYSAYCLTQSEQLLSRALATGTVFDQRAAFVYIFGGSSLLSLPKDLHTGDRVLGLPPALIEGECLNDINKALFGLEGPSNIYQWRGEGEAARR